MFGTGKIADVVLKGRRAHQAIGWRTTDEKHPQFLKAIIAQRPSPNQFAGKKRAPLKHVNTITTHPAPVNGWSQQQDRYALLTPEASLALISLWIEENENLILASRSGC
jgi:hypothetical protein